MSDVNVTVSNVPIQVSVSTPGPAGQPGAQGAAGLGAGGGVTGLSITGSLAISGNVLITGVGGTSTLLSGNTLYISSQVGGGGGEVNTASSIGNGLSIFSSKVGVDLQFYSITGGTGIRISQSGNQISINNNDLFITSSNLNGLISTGQGDLRYLSSGVSGEFLKNSNLNGLANTGYVQSTSGSINERINLITNNTGNFVSLSQTGQFYPTSNPAQYIKSGEVNTISGSLSERLSQTGTNLIALFSASSAGVSSLNSLSGILTLAGQGNISVTTGVGTITISGNTSQFLTTGYNIASINDLKNIQITGLANNTIVYVRSYYADYADRGLGGGQFVWKSSSTSTEDSGRYLSSNTSPALGRWERLLNGETPNVMMWGAKGDATVNGRFFTAGNNDTPTIQKALDSARYGWNSELHFPAATYKITGTLYWDAQQTKIIGDGCVNGTRIWMDSGINRDILVSYGAKALLDHNSNPATGTDPAIISIQNDFPRIENIQFGYAGHYNVVSVTANEPLQNAANSCLVFTLPGETNGIHNLMLEGGRYGIRVLGPNGPGLRIYDSTIAGQGDAAISIEAPIYQTWNGSAWVLATGEGVGMVTLDNCSSDYRGAYYTGYSFVKVQSGASPNIYIRNLKLEGEFPSGVVNYQRPYEYNSKIGSIDIDGLTWNVTQSHGIEQNLVLIHPADNRVIHSVNTNIKNCQVTSTDNIIKDYVAIGESGLPFIYIPDRDTALSQQNFIPEINYQATRLNGLANDSNWYSSLALYKNDSLQIKFTPNRTGWWRVARGIGNTSNLLNHDLSISHYYGVSKLKLVSDNKYPKSCEISSDSTIYNTAYIPVTRARFFHNTLPWSGTSDYPLFLDVFVDKLVTGNGFTDSMKRIIINSPQLGIGQNAEEEYTHIINPIFVSGTENVSYSSSSFPYCEVDLTRKQDRGTSFQTNYGNTLLANKDFHLFLDSNRNLRFFDAGVTVSFNGGGGSAAGDAIVVNGELKHIILSDTGNNYTSHPTISITPKTSGNGTGAFASGTFSLNGGLQRIVILSGGAGYGLPPLGDNYGYTYLQTGTSGEFYRASNPNQFIRSGDVSSQYLSSGASGNFVTLNTTQVIKSAKTLSGLNNATDFNFYGASNQSNSNPIISIYGITGNSTYSKVVSLGQSGLVLHGQKDTNYYSNLYNSTDVLNGGIDALYLAGTNDGNNRLFLGAPGKSWYSVDFTYVNNLANISTIDVTSRIGHTYGRYIGGEGGQQNHWQSYYGWAIKPNMAGNYTNAYSIVGAGLDDFGLIIAGQNPSTKQFVVRAAANQMTGLIEWQDSNGGILGIINASGKIGIGNSSPISILDVSGNIYASGGKVLTSTDSGNLQTQINTESNKQTITGISITGSNSITGLINIQGIYGTNIILSGSNTIGISGGGAGGGTTNITNNYSINSGSGIFIYRSGIASGVSQQFFDFPTLLDARPIVLATLHNDNFNTLLNFQVSGANPTGFYGLFSATTSNTGYYLDIFASNSQQTGMATNVIVNNNVNVVGASGIITYNSGSVIGVAAYPFSKSISVEFPNSGDNVCLFYNPRPLNVSQLNAWVSGDNNPFVTYSLRFTTGRAVAGTEVNIGGNLCNNTNTGNQQLIFDNSYISGNCWCYLYILATGGSPKQFHLTSFLNYV